MSTHIYPFSSKVKQLTKQKDLTLLALGEQIGRSERWVQKIDKLEDISVGYVVKISEVLDFDFMSDYYAWLKRESPDALPMLSEPSDVYRSGNDITITVTMRGNIKKAGEMLQKIKATADGEGFKID